MLTEERNCPRHGTVKHYKSTEFHHINGKDFGIGKFGTRSYSRLLEEAKKSILVCCRCHREIHAEDIHP